MAEQSLPDLDEQFRSLCLQLAEAGRKIIRALEPIAAQQRAKEWRHAEAETAETSVAPAVVFEPQCPAPPDLEIVPHTEIIPGQLRVHFHRGGLSFGLVDPRAPDFAALVTYEKARSLMLRAAMECAAKPGEGR